MIRQERYEKNIADSKYYIRDNSKKNSKAKSKKNSKVKSKKNSKKEVDTTTSSLDSACNPALLNEIFKITNH